MKESAITPIVVAGMPLAGGFIRREGEKAAAAG